jgi:hypothetical protein
VRDALFASRRPDARSGRRARAASETLLEPLHQVHDLAVAGIRLLFRELRLLAPALGADHAHQVLLVLVGVLVR